MKSKAKQQPKIKLGAKIIRKDGTVEDLGTIAESKVSKGLFERIKEGLSAKR